MNGLRDLTVGLVAVSTLVLSGCGSDDSSGSSSSANVASGYTKTTNTFTANTSALSWQDNSDVYNSGASSLDGAKQVCSELDIDGFNDWRLPTEDEVTEFYKTYRDDLTYTYENYKEESYYNFARLRHLTWADKYDTYIDGSYYRVINEILASQSSYAVFQPKEGYQTGLNYSIRCVRDN
ncbi:MAG: hypothetical protein U9O83_02190 [Campylobacterota bacterium]|nr:hypothetical protein [Campylobacterota bacterium]